MMEIEMKPSNMFDECIYGSFVAQSAVIGGALSPRLALMPGPKLLHNPSASCPFLGLNL